MDILETVKDTFVNAITSMKEFFNEETTTTRKTLVIVCAIFTLIGIVYGFLIAPIKKGVLVNITNINDDSYVEDEE